MILKIPAMRFHHSLKPLISSINFRCDRMIILDFFKHFVDDELISHIVTEADMKVKKNMKRYISLPNMK